MTMNGRPQADSATLAGRYAFERYLPTASRVPVWLAIDTQTERTVVIKLLRSERAAVLESAVGLHHPHLAELLHVVPAPRPWEMPPAVPASPGQAAVVAEHLPGRTLRDVLGAGRPAPEVATLWVTHVASAVAASHAAGAVHGAISPRSVLVATSPEQTSPVLTRLVAPTDAAYCSLPRLDGRGPSAQDDVWALSCTLFAALTCRAPYHGESRGQIIRRILTAPPQPLSCFGIDAPELQAILGRVFALKGRLEAAELHEALTRWLSRRAAEPAPPDEEVSVIWDDVETETWVRPMPGATRQSSETTREAERG